MRLPLRFMMFTCICLLLNACFNGEKFEGKTYQVRRGPLVNQVEASGVLQSADGVYVQVPKVAGVHEFTISFLAPEGIDVTVGMPIVSFDAKVSKDRLRTAEGQLASERKSLEKLQLEEQETLENLLLDSEEQKVNVARAFRKQDVPEDQISRLDIEKNKRDYRLAQAQEQMALSKVAQQRQSMAQRIADENRIIENLETEVVTLQSAIEQMTVKAPKDGLVVYEENWDGDKPAVGDRMWVGRSIMQLPDLSKMQVKAAVDEPDASRVSLDMVAEIRMDANPDRLFLGKVTHLGRVFYKKSKQKPAIVFDAIITIDEPDKEVMRPGMTANVSLVVDRADEVLLLDDQGVFFEDDKAFVLVIKDGKSRKRVVQLGRSASGFSEVLSGLKDNDIVGLQASMEEGS